MNIWRTSGTQKEKWPSMSWRLQIRSSISMEILGCDPFGPEEAARKIGIIRVDFETLIAKSDVTSLHVPLTPETEGLIGEHQIALMKRGVWIVNTSRGKIID